MQGYGVALYNYLRLFQFRNSACRHLDGFLDQSFGVEIDVRPRVLVPEYRVLVSVVHLSGLHYSGNHL